MKEEVKNKKLIALGILFLLFLVLLFLNSDISYIYQKIGLIGGDSPEYLYQEGVEPSNVYGTKVYTQWIEVDGKARVGEKRIIKYLVIHETDNFAKSATAQNHANYLSYNNKTTTSWHYTVDDHSIYHHIPDDEIAHHAGDQEGNQHGIGIELCVNEGGNFDKTFENGARLAAYLLKTYHLDISALKMHHDFSGKDCPHTIIERHLFSKFKKRVEYYLSKEE